MHLIAIYYPGDADICGVLDVDDACRGDERCGGCDNCILAQSAHYGATGSDWYGPVEQPRLRTVRRVCECARDPGGVVVDDRHCLLHGEP